MDRTLNAKTKEIVDKNNYHPRQKPTSSSSYWLPQYATSRRRNSEDAASASSNSRSTLPNGIVGTSSWNTSAKQRETNKKIQLARKKRLETWADTKGIEMKVEDESGLVAKLKTIYDELFASKPPMDAFYVLITTLRTYYEGETWKDCVEESVRAFLTRYLLQPASQMANKYLQFETLVPLSRKIDEYKLQVLLHAYSIGSEKDSNLNESLVDKIVNLLGIISLISDAKVLREFFEDLFDNFVDSIPRHLTRLYEELNQPIPSELEQYSLHENEVPFYEPLVVPSPQKLPRSASSKSLLNNKTLPSIQQEDEESDDDQRSNMSSTSLSQSSRSFRCSRSFVDSNKHHRLITVSSSGARKLKLGRKHKSQGNLEPPSSDNSNAVDFTEAFEKMRQPTKMKRALNFNGSTVKAIKKAATTPVGKGQPNCQLNKLAPETPTFHQVPDSERKRRKMTKIFAEPRAKRFVVQETPPRFWAKLPGSVLSRKQRVRQSPRQHASTRALYSCAPPLVKQLVQFSSSIDSEKDEYEFNLLDDVANDAGLCKNGNSPNFVCLKSAPSTSTAAHSRTASSTKRKSTGVISQRDRTPCQIKQPRQSAVSSDKKSAKPVATVSPMRKLKKNLSQTFSNEDSNSTWSINSVSCATLSASCGPRMTFTSSNQTEQQRISGSFSSPTKNANSRDKNSANASLPCNGYAMPGFAVSNYVRYVNSIKRERTKPTDDLFYARNNHRNSVFSEITSASAPPETRSTAIASSSSTAAAAPKSRSGRKMKASVQFIHSANYLLNINNKNPSNPCNLRNLHRTLSLSTPIKLNKKLRQLPKNCRKRYHLNGKNGNNSAASSTCSSTASTNVGEFTLKAETSDSLMSPMKT